MVDLEAVSLPQHRNNRITRRLAALVKVEALVDRVIPHLVRLAHLIRRIPQIHLTPQTPQTPQTHLTPQTHPIRRIPQIHLTPQAHPTSPATQMAHLSKTIRASRAAHRR